MPSGRARTAPDHLETVLIAAVVGRRKDLRAVRIANDLNKTFAIAEVNEDHAAVVAATVGPTCRGSQSGR